jgi:hypothetical protein
MDRSRRYMGPEILAACRQAAQASDTIQTEVTIDAIGAYEVVVSYTTSMGAARKGRRGLLLVPSYGVLAHFTGQACLQASTERLLSPMRTAGVDRCRGQRSGEAHHPSRASTELGPSRD